MMKTIFEMETGDPDDYISLIILLGHPQVNLIGVNVTPGSGDQISLVKHALNIFEMDIPIGSFICEDDEKNRVSQWHFKAFPDIKIRRVAPDLKGCDLLNDLFKKDVTLITGSPLKNIGRFLMNNTSNLGKIFVQGGFAGDGVVPEALQLDKFKNKKSAPTYNFNGYISGALKVIESEYFLEKRFISKNVCHKVFYNKELHNIIGEKIKSSVDKQKLSLSLIHQGMEFYIKNGKEKKFHDPLAVACAINPQIGVWKNVDIFREQDGSWGSVLSDNPLNKIIIDYDYELFLKTLMFK